MKYILNYSLHKISTTTFIVLLSCLSATAQPSLNESPHLEKRFTPKGKTVSYFTIGNLLFVYRTPLLRDPNRAVKEFEKVIAPDQAIRSAKPDYRIEQMIMDELENEHTFHFKKAILTSSGLFNIGKDGLFWQVQWYLLPSGGGFSGVPWTYQGIVCGNGDVIHPEISLWSSFPIHDHSAHGSDIFIRSHFKLDVLIRKKPEKQDKKILFGDEISTLAKNQLVEFSTKHQIASMGSSEGKKSDQPLQWRLHSQNMIQLDGHDFWKIEFTDESWGAEEAIDNRVLTIWVTPSGEASELSLGSEEYR